MTTAGPDMGVACRDALPLDGPAALDPLLDRVGSARCVLLGGASLGTAEYHRWRVALTRRLIEEKGFSFVALDAAAVDAGALDAAARTPQVGDRPWPEATVPDAAAPGGSGPYSIGPGRSPPGSQRRWPSWIWADPQVRALVRRLRRRDARLPARERTGFFGLDGYDRWDALRTIVAQVRERVPDHLPYTVRACAALEHPAAPDQGVSPTRLVPSEYEEEIVSVLLRRGRYAAGGHTGREAPDGARERYYRTLVGGGRAASDAHTRQLADTLESLLARHGAAAKAVVWAHNAQAGDARGSGAARRPGPLSLGQLVRQRHGATDTVLTGFASHSGTVTAAVRWEGRPTVLELPPARPGSLEDRLRETVRRRAALFVVPEESYRPGWLRELIDLRELGVVYRPESESDEEYVATVVGQRFDAFLYLDRTSALASGPGLPATAPAPERL